jgi:hydroxyacylglutathione hydrolase
LNTQLEGSGVTAEPMIVPVVDEGLGNSAYLVDLGDRRALAVDPCRDLRALHARARRHGWHIAFAADTHLHADFVSAARQLAATEGAELIASAAGNREYPHRGLCDGDAMDLGGLTLRALGTPGHTPEHVCYLLLDGTRQLGVFTGGSLIVGGAARTDLVSPQRTEELARAQYRSLQRLLTLPDDVAVWPTHGAGSFCSTPRSAERTSTIGRERATNALLQVREEDSFVQALLGSLGSFPPYFLRLAEINRRGPRVLVDDPALVPLGVETVAWLMADGVQLVDARPVTGFAAGHIPGALSIPLRAAFATWLGWLLEPDRPVVFLRAADQDPEEIVWQSLKIGVEPVLGELAGGMTAWLAAGKPVAHIGLVGPEELPGRAVLDVRQDDEFNRAHVPGALHVELGALRDSVPPLPTGPLTVMCGHGERAMTAASLLASRGRPEIAVLVGSVDDWSEVTGAAPETV